MKQILKANKGPTKQRLSGDAAVAYMTTVMRGA